MSPLLEAGGCACATGNVQGAIIEVLSRNLVRLLSVRSVVFFYRLVARAAASTTTGNQVT